MSRRAVIIGGTFNPFTNAHRQMIVEAAGVFPEADIFCVPSNLNYISAWKDLPTDRVFSGADRLQVIRQSLDDIKNCTVSDCEINGGLSGKTYDTVEYFRNELGYEQVVICMGSDKLFEIKKWYKSEELVRNVEKIILFTRGEKLADCKEAFVRNLCDKIIEIDFDYPTLSSSSIRALYEEGKLSKIQELVPKPVYEYLKGASEMFTNEKFNVEKVTEDLLNWIRDWFESNGRNCNAIIGISGGKDSTVCAGLCAAALGPDRVVGVMMPNGIQPDIDDSKKICEHLGIKHVVFNIKDAVDGELAELERVAKELGTEITPQTKINLPPRIRMATLYAVGQSMNGRVINTCNLSEDYVGYSTRYGDAAGDVSLLANLTVDEVKQIGRYLKLPLDLVEKAPSDGLCGKTDEDNLGFKYNELDRYIRTGVCEDEAKKKLMDEKHVRNLFKLLPMPHFEYDGN